MARPRVLVLFPGRWEAELLARLAAEGAVDPVLVGADGIGFRHLVAGRRFDPRRLLDRLGRRYRGIDAVWSNQDMLGTLLAALVAERLGLPGPGSLAVVRSQHKLLAAHEFARQDRAQAPRCGLLPGSLTEGRVPSLAALEHAVAAAGLSWPVFVKPVKGTFSAMARRVGSAAELHAHLRLAWLDRRLLAATTAAFERLAELVVPLPAPAGAMLCEEVVEAVQVNVDGWLADGRVEILGVVDEIMYPQLVAGARHFAAFELPSRQPAETQQQLAVAVADAVRRFGLVRGLFNAELFVLADGSLRWIELNPRAAGQFDSLYRSVHGVELLRSGIELALGKAVPELPPRPLRGAAASFVFREFAGQRPPRLRAGAEHWLADRHPAARLWCERAGWLARTRERRWLGSHRYAVLNLAADDVETLRRQGQACAERLFGAGLPGA